MSVPTTERAPSAAPPLEGFTLFHEDWWLDIVSEGRVERLSVLENGQPAAVLPILVTTGRTGLKRCRMPPFTHLLGPALQLGPGSETARLHRRFKLTSELLAQVPEVADFRHVLDWTVPEALAFQCLGYRATPHYTIRVDCADMDVAWKDMRQKTRRFIRRSQETHEALVHADCDEFVAFYLQNLQARRRADRGEMARFPLLYAACRQRDCGEIFSVRTTAGTLAAAIFVVWGHGVMYYLLTTRSRDTQDYGLVSLLILRAMQEANRRGVVLDLDGIASQAIFHFLSGFGGAIRTRTVVQKRAPWLELGSAAWHAVRGTRESTFF